MINGFSCNQHTKHRTDWAERNYAPRRTVMQDGRQKKSASSGGHGGGGYSSSLSNNSKQQQQQTKFAKWSSNSKFNKILNNIERSIMAQFNAGPSDAADHRHHKEDNTSRSASSKQQASSSRISTSGRSASSGSIPLTKTKAIIATKSANKLPSESRSMQAGTTHHQNQTDRVTASESQLGKSDNSSKELATAAGSQPTPANRGGKMILNKYQQQFVSAIQTNKNRLAVNKNSAISNSSYSHNRLSIPPPHANDEARNQNHRLLFGCPRNQPSDFNSTNDQMASTYEQRSRAAATDTANQHPALFYHSSASPASSAQSLPVIKPRLLPAPQSRLRTDAADEEESGFSTYQSRRSLANNAPSANRVSSDSGRPDMFMQNSRFPFENSTRVGLHNLAPHQLHQQQQQQQMIHQNSLRSRITQHQSTNNTQQQQFNQVPISQGVMYNSNSLMQQQMNSHQQQQNTNRLSDNRNQIYGSYGHLGPMPPSQITMQQQYRTQPLYDGQIYANAPPKPRRYQYYDPSFNINSQSAGPITTSQNYPPPHPTFSQQNSGPLNRQFAFNGPTGQAQTYTQQHGGLINGVQLPYRPQCQLPMLPAPSTLTKSKSSLDVADLSRFKRNGIQANEVLRVQPQSSNVPIYGSTKFINQIEPSTMQSNPNYHPQITVNYHQQQQPPTNLQRSKSIGNLLPDYNAHLAQRQLAPLSANHLHQQHSITSAYPKFLTVSSASTNNLNYVGLVNNNTMLMNYSVKGSGQVNQIMQQTAPIENNNGKLYNSDDGPRNCQFNNSHNTNSRFRSVCYVNQKIVDSLIQKQHQQQLLAAQISPQPPMRQSYQGSANAGAFWPNQPQNKGTIYNNGDGQIAKTNTISNSGKTVRQSQNGSVNNSTGMPHADGSSFVAQSLDDKIRHLLIGDDSTCVGGANDSINKTESREVAAAWPAQQQSQLQISRQTQSSQKEADTQSAPVYGASLSFADRQQDQTFTNNSENSRLIIESQNNHPDPASTSMGNRNQRQYQVVGVSGAGSQDQQLRIGQRNIGNHGDSMSTNSQLIVDLTTPRVLAKTQTTLLPATGNHVDQTPRPSPCRPQEAWSMNQLGLPTNYVDQFALNAQTAPDISSPDQGFGLLDKIDASDAGSFPAPYYYSDLKSEEQRRALFNIVQQKSLSPPPQLLSRSFDQNNTRLGPKSATMHSSQARVLSETLAASQRRALSNNPFQDSKSTTNITGVSSNSSVAKNIDKLFESPVDPQLGRATNDKLHSVQSMLALSTDPSGGESISAISRVPSDQNQIESLSNSSGYCSDAWKRAVSRSKSLENISQRTSHPNDTNDFTEATGAQDKLRRHGNPVYENIRRSDKLLSAINNSTTCLSISSTRHRKARSSLPAARPQPTSGSDSMDSILGSSFDDEGDDSDENPGDIDSDNSATGIDFIKLSPTTADMSELIEQLKSNHAKLTDEYKSTLERISKILNRKDSSGKRKISDKLAGRLLRLEHKSKKCESRSKNQLALIQMMEKAFRQTRQEAGEGTAEDATCQHKVNKSVPLQVDEDKLSDANGTKFSPQTSISPGQTSLSCVNPSTCNSIDYQNLESTNDQSVQPKAAPPAPPQPPPPPVFEAQNVIKAIVTEATSAEIPRKFVAELCKQSIPIEKPSDETAELVSLSTQHEQAKNHERKSRENARPLSTGTVGQRIQSIESISKNNGKSTHKTNQLDETGPDDKGNAESKRKSPSSFHDIGDDEDFIEFLSTGSKSTHGRSLFESSQFSASDFNNSSSSGSTSESSHSGSVTIDSLDISRPQTKNNGILKGGPRSSKSDDKSSKKMQSNRNNDNIHKINNNSHNSRDDKARGENKFKNVLGNVIDVDVYPVNLYPPTSQCSPVSNK